MHLTVTFQRREVDIDIEDDATLSALAQTLSDRTGASPETMKIFGQGLKSACQPSRAPETRVRDAGIKPGSKLMLVASLPSEVAQVRAAVDMPGVIGFEEELLRYARRRNLRGTVAPKPPSGPYTFSQYKVLLLPGAQPGPDEALKLLHRLAADPGIVGIMKEHRFEVGLLSEMPPTDHMDEQRQVTCLLGLNINRGQEIKLRLRTNDLNGFRKYDTIRETLVHELTHNVWGDHDNRFKTLNSQLLRECIRLSKGGTVLGSSDVYEGQAGDYLDEILQRDMAATKQARTLRQAGATLPAPASAAEAAARAALARFGPSPASAAVALGPGPSAPANATSQAVEDIARAYEHEDASTQAEEEAMRALGTFADDEPQIVQARPSTAGPRGGGATTATPSSSHAPSQRVADTSHAPLTNAAERVSADVARSRSESEHDGMDADAIHTVSTPPANAANDTSSADRASADAPEPMQVDTPWEGSTFASDESAPGASTGHQAVDNRTQSKDAAGQQTADPSTMEDMDKMARELGVGREDPMLERAARVDEAMRDLERSASHEQLLTALKTVHTILSNSLKHPGNERFASVRRSNKAFSQRVAAWPAAERLLQLAGFSLRDGESWSLGSRQDPGMLWLVSSMIQNRVEQYAH